jgi:transposase
VDSHLQTLAKKLISSANISRARKQPSTNENKAGLLILESSIEDIKIRSLGSELLCQNMWERLNFEKILLGAGLTRRDIALARATVFGRLISPGSELHTHDWFQTLTSLPQFPGADISGVGKDAFYEIADKLYDRQRDIERALVRREKELFPSSRLTLFLYDLTNTYFEGAALGNSDAAFGHCKSKRTDCRIVTLSLVVNQDGLPVKSHIYKGNQGEPETLTQMLDDIEDVAQTDMFDKPTIVMDRGIATKENVDFLRDNGYDFVVVKREDASEAYRADFESHKTTFREIACHTSSYGDQNHVYVKKVSGTGKTCKVLCVSEGKAKTEQAIQQKKEQKLIDDLERLRSSIERGTLYQPKAVSAKLDSILKRHRPFAPFYTVSVQTEPREHKSGKPITKNGEPLRKATHLEYIRSSTQDHPPLFGCYVIESTHTEMSDSELWHLYMTQVKVEHAFQCLKSDLGLRPVHHQIARRTESHLFITVLAYHILAATEYLLHKAGDTRSFDTIRQVLSTHSRITSRMKDSEQSLYHLTKSSVPEQRQRAIYDILGVTDPLGRELKKLTEKMKIPGTL